MVVSAAPTQGLDGIRVKSMVAAPLKPGSLPESEPVNPVVGAPVCSQFALPLTVAALAVSTSTGTLVP